MAPYPAAPTAHASITEIVMRRALAAMSVLTIVMTVPQIWTIWIAHQAAGVSAVSWTAYLISALLWFWHGLRMRDKNIYLPCIGWIAADSAVIVGALVYG